MDKQTSIHAGQLRTFKAFMDSRKAQTRRGKSGTRYLVRPKDK